MDFEKFTDRARSIIQAAQQAALSAGHQQFTPEHVLLALLEDDSGLSRNLINAAGSNPTQIADLTTSAVQALPRVEGGSGQLYLAPKTAEIFKTAEEAAKEYQLVQEAHTCLSDKANRQKYHAVQCSPTRYRFLTQGGGLSNQMALFHNLSHASFGDKTRLVLFVSTFQEGGGGW